MKTKKLEISGLFLAALFMASSAKAAVYDFTYLSSASSGYSYDVSGLLTTSNVLNALGGYNITNISGAVFGTGGGVINSLVSNPTPGVAYNNGVAIYDNVLFPTSSPHLDNAGVLFTTASGNTWNIYSLLPFNNSSTDYALFSYVSANGTRLLDPLNGTFFLSYVSNVPEPSTWAMMLGGLGLIGFMSYRRREYF
jgi:hypothetical protein